MANNPSNIWSGDDRILSYGRREKIDSKSVGILTIRKFYEHIKKTDKLWRYILSMKADKDNSQFKRHKLKHREYINCPNLYMIDSCFWADNRLNSYIRLVRSCKFIDCDECIAAKKCKGHNDRDGVAYYLVKPPSLIF